jgi:hypothetical protein
MANSQATSFDENESPHNGVNHTTLNAPDTTIELPGDPTLLSTLIARDKPLDAQATTARAQWTRVHNDLNQTFWSEKYDPQALQESKDTLTAFLAPGSKTTLGEAEKSLDKLSRSLLPAKSPAELEKTFWQRVSEAKHESYLFQLHAIYKAAAISTDHALAKAEYKVLSFARAYHAEVNHKAVDRMQDEVTPKSSTDTPIVLPTRGERFHDLPAPQQAQIREQIATAVDDIEKLSPQDLGAAQRAAIKTYLGTTRAYLSDAAGPADLARAAASISAATPPAHQREFRDIDTRWPTIALDARNTATLTRELAAYHNPPPAMPAPALAASPR